MIVFRPPAFLRRNLQNYLEMYKIKDSSWRILASPVRVKTHVNGLEIDAMMLHWVTRLALIFV